jgi:hypothetical protein
VQGRRQTKRRLGGPALWRRGLSFPIYVPNELTQIGPLLSAGRVFDACGELWRLTSLGSNQAAALLQYMYVRGICWEPQRRATVHLKCQQAAMSGYSYAQYVMAIGERVLADHASALKWLDLANKQSFGPALAESGRMAAVVGHQFKIARAFFWRGIRTYHLPSVVYYLSFCIRGKYGLPRRLVALLLFPLVVSLLQLIAWLFPYKLFVFSHLFKKRAPLIDSTKC